MKILTGACHYVFWHIESYHEKSRNDNYKNMTLLQDIFINCQCDKIFGVFWDYIEKTLY